jgi:predicted MFS family arabinose efflux permease
MTRTTAVDRRRAKRVQPNTASTSPEQSGRRRGSTYVAFLIAGLGSGAWAPLVPFAQSRAGLGDGALGLLLLCLGTGSIITMPLAGALTAVLGCRFVITVSAAIVALTLPLLAVLSAWPWLVATLLLFGAGIGAMDVSMNVQAIIVERTNDRPMMSGFHGLFSLGGIIGAGGIATILGLGTGPLTAALCISGCVIAALAASAAHLLPFGSGNDGPLFALPHGIVLLMGLMCFAGFLAEGAVLDWSAVLLLSRQHVASANAGLGYAAFAAAMTIGRFLGDQTVSRLGDKRVVLFGGLIAATGFASAALASSWQLALLSYACIGAGCSNIVPVLFRLVGRQTIMPENVAVPAITTLGYAGILAGPAAIGFLAHAISLPAAFICVSALLAAVGVAGTRLR